MEENVGNLVLKKVTLRSPIGLNSRQEYWGCFLKKLPLNPRKDF